MRGVLYLASTSPRRRDLLRAAGLGFELHPPGPEPAGEGTPRDLVVQRARSKAVHAPPPPGPGVVLGVDTIVVVDDQELGKPADRDDAARMLRRLAARDHEVLSAHCLVRPATGAVAGAVVQECAAATVRCAPLDEAVIAQYLDGLDWVDKAGGYGIQSDAAAFMSLVEGSLDTVIGLHVPAVVRLLEALPGTAACRSGSGFCWLVC